VLVYLVGARFGDSGCSLGSFVVSVVPCGAWWLGIQGFASGLVVLILRGLASWLGYLVLSRVLYTRLPCNLKLVLYSV